MTQQENITALTGKLSTIESNFAAVKTAIKSRAKKTELPTKLTDLTDDILTGYSKAASVTAISASDSVKAAVGKLEKAIDGKQATGSYANASHTHTKSEITDLTLPTKVSDLTNDSGFQTATDVATAISNTAHLKKQIVQTLPTAQSADANTIYSILASDGAGSDLYDEYMLVNGALEKIGASRIDITNYYTKSEIDTYIASLINTSITALTSSDFEDTQSS